MKKYRVFLLTLFLGFITNNCWAIDRTFNWAVPTDSTTYHEICWGTTSADLNTGNHCANVGFTTGTVNGVTRTMGTVYGLTDGVSYFFASRACSALECSTLCNPIFVDASPTTTYTITGDYDGDGISDRIYKNATGQVMIDYSIGGFNTNNSFDVILSGYGDATYTPVLNIDDDEDGKLDLAFEDGFGNTYIDHSSNGFNGWDEILYKSYNHLMWINGSTAGIWKVDTAGNWTSWKSFTAETGWTPKSYTVDSDGIGYLMWVNDTTAAIWKIDIAGNWTSWKSFTAATGWTPKSYTVDSNGIGYLMWANSSTAAIWKIDIAGNWTSWKSFTAAGWIPTTYEIGQNNIGYLMWANGTTAALWKIDTAGAWTGWKSFTAVAGWGPKSYTIDSNGIGYLMWINGISAGIWKVDTVGNWTSWKGFTAATGWTATTFNSN